MITVAAAHQIHRIVVEPMSTRAGHRLHLRAWHLLWAELQEYLRQGLGLTIPRDVRLHVLGASEMAYRTGWGLPVLSEVLGCYIERAGENAVLVDRDIPHEMAAEVLAHELAHAWQTRSCPLNQSEALREGFAQWVAFRYCAWKGFSRHQRAMLRRAGVKGHALRQLLAVERAIGLSAFVARVRAVRRLQDVGDAQVSISAIPLR